MTARLAETLGIDVVASTPVAFGDFLDGQTEQWGRLVRDHDIRDMIGPHRVVRGECY